MTQDPPSPPRLLYLVTEDWYFLSHRLPVARAARDAGFEVLVATRIGDGAAAIRAEGFRPIPLERLRRRGLSPWSALSAIRELVGVYRRESPQIVHHVALKPVLFGTMAALLAGVPAVINALAGLGYVFTATTPGTRLLRPLVGACFRLLLGRKRCRLIVQNRDDETLFRRIMPPERIHLIPGSGVDVESLHPLPEPAPDPPTAAIVARMLWDKGIGEAVEARRLLHRRGLSLRLVLAGGRDPANPRCIDEKTLNDWQAEGLVEWRGHCPDIMAVWKDAHIALLPSHREGMPKALLEAAALGRPLIATDVPGCRDLVRHEQNGLLVPLGDAQALADALERLAADPALRARLGAAARQDAVQRFSAALVAEKTLALYRTAATSRAKKRPP